MYNGNNAIESAILFSKLLPKMKIVIIKLFQTFMTTFLNVTRGCRMLAAL